MRKLGTIAAILLAVGCSSGSTPARLDDGDLPAAPTSEPRVRALSSLERETHRPWTFVQHARTAVHLAGAREGAPTETARVGVERATRDFLARHKELFGLRDADRELALTREETDSLAMTHVRLRQQTHGVPVVGAEIMVHYDDKGVLTSLDSTFVPGLDAIDVQPRLDGDEAARIAVADAAAIMKDVDPGTLAPSSNVLVVHALGDREPRLAYELRTRALASRTPAIWVTTIDALTGAVLDRYNDLQSLQGSGIGVLGDTKKLEIASQGGKFVLFDATRGIRTHDAGGQDINADQGAPLVSSSSATSWDTQGRSPGSAVDAHFYAGLVADYYRQVHGRQSIDGKGGPLVSTVHYGQDTDNAFWDGSSMLFLDGGEGKALSGSVEIVGHEFTHGVTQLTSNLRYQGMSGALNEAVSDIFGAFIEHRARPNDTSTNVWKNGEGITSPVRDLTNPRAGQQPDHMTRYVQTQQDSGGVHTNSGIPNNAAFLMTMGGKNATSRIGPQFGIGWEKAEKVWYRVNTKYLTETSTFGAAAVASLQAAKDLGLTVNEQNIIDCAWKAVGVAQGACGVIVDPRPKPTPTTAPGGDEPAGDVEAGGVAPEDSTLGGVGGDDADSDAAEGEEPAPAKKKKRIVAAPGSQGACSVGPRAPRAAGPFAPLAGASVVIVAWARRRRREPRRGAVPLRRS